MLHKYEKSVSEVTRPSWHKMSEIKLLRGVLKKSIKLA